MGGTSFRTTRRALGLLAILVPISCTGSGEGGPPEGPGDEARAVPDLQWGSKVPLLCPDTVGVSAAPGGTIRLGRQAQLFIPAGALEASPPTHHIGFKDHNGRSQGHLYTPEVRVRNLRLRPDSTARLTLAYAGCTVGGAMPDTSRIRIYRFSDGGIMEGRMTTVSADLSRQTLTAAIPGNSRYAVGSN